MNFYKIKKNLFLFFYLISTTALFFGCSTSGSKATKITQVKIPEKYNLAINGKRDIKKWWKEFHSEELNALVEKGLQNNQSIKASFYSMKKAEATAKKAGAALFPEINIEAGSSLSTSHSNSSSTETKASSIGLAASYEIDLWGKIRSKKEAAAISAKASQKDLEAAGITIVSAIVNTWKDIISAKLELNLEKRIEAENKKQLHLLKLRFKNGMVNASEVYDQEKNLLLISSEINSTESNIKILKNKLAYYTGESDIRKFKEYFLPEIEEIPDTGIPADLIESRPDVNAAKLRFISSCLTLNYAKKDLLPSLSLSGSLSLTSDNFSLSFDDWLSSVAANIVAPIFRGGYLKQEVNRSKAESDEYLYNYAAAFYSAINEVQDAIAREKHQQINISFLKKRIEAASKALIYSRYEYESGSSDYISVIERYNALKNLEINLVEAKASLIEYRVSLYRALGNSWTDQYIKNLREKNGQ